MHTDKDSHYWALRQENDQFIKQQQWQPALSQAAVERKRLGTEAEEKVTEYLRALGYQVNPTPDNCEFDLWVAGSAGRAIRVEVKISLYHGRRYQANIHHDQADLVVFIARNGQDWPYVIPMTEIGQRHNIAIWSKCPGDYKGQWKDFLNAWDHLHQAITEAQPQSYQLSYL
jgi:hypothetical protein